MKCFHWSGKVAVLLAQKFEDDVALQAVNDIETLTTGLSQKIWQKVSILHYDLSSGRNRRYGRVDPVSTFCESGRTVGQALSAEREPHGRRDRRAADVDVALVQMAVAVGTRLVLKPPAPSAPAVGSLRRHGESATSEGAMARRFGYSRVSTSAQNWSLQLEALTKAGVDDRDIFREKASGAQRDRTELRRMLDRSGRVMRSLSTAWIGLLGPSFTSCRSWRSSRARARSSCP